MKALILARVSTEDQMVDGQSIPAQLARAREYCKLKGLTVKAEYQFDESSLKDHRKKFELVIDEVRNSKEILVLVAETIDRVQRSFKESVMLLELIKAGKVEVHFIREGLIIHKDSNSSEFIRWDMGVMFARSFVLNISDNVKRTFELKRRNGEWTGVPRIGYINSLDANGKKDIIPDPDRAHLVTRFFQLYGSGGYSIKTARAEVIRLGLKTKEGKDPSESVMEHILKDSFYYGMANSKRHGLYPHRYQRLISKELFDKCQEIRTGRKQNQIFKSRDAAFKGLLHCPKCGCSMTPEIKTKKSGLVFVYYSCTNAKRICKREYIPEKVLLKPVYAVLERFESITQEAHDGLVNELRKGSEAEVEFHNQEIRRIQVEYSKVQGKLDNLLDLLLDSSIAKNDYDKKSQELRDRQAKLSIELEEYAKGDTDYKTLVSTTISLARRANTLFEGSEPAEKRVILNFLLQNPTLNGKKLVFTMKKPWDTVLEFASTPNWLRR